MRNVPLALDVTVRTAPVSDLVAVIEAPGIPPPEESTTFPVIDPVGLWAKSRPEGAAAKRRATTHRKRAENVLPGIQHLTLSCCSFRAITTKALSFIKRSPQGLDERRPSGSPGARNQFRSDSRARVPRRLASSIRRSRRAFEDSATRGQLLHTPYPLEPAAR